MPLECFPAIHSAFHSYACVVVAVIIIRGFFYMPGNLVSSVFMLIRLLNFPNESAE